MLQLIALLLAAQVSVQGDHEPTPSGPPDAHRVRVGGLGERYTVHRGDPRGLLPSSISNPFQGLLERVQDGSTGQLPDGLGAAYDRCAPGVAVAFRADVTIEHLGAGGLELGRRTVGVQGTLQADGRFDVVCRQPVEAEGERHTLTTRVIFDGTALFELGEDAPANNAYSTDYPRFATNWGHRCGFLQPVYEWLTDPLRVPLFENASYEVETDGDWMRIGRLVQWGASVGKSEVHLCDLSGAVPKVSRVDVLDALFRVRKRVELDEPVQVAAGVYRPMQSVETRFLDGTPDGRRVVVTMRMREAELLTDPALDAPVFDDEATFQVWR